jgi:hypothetical protein
LEARRRCVEAKPIAVKDAFADVAEEPKVGLFVHHCFGIDAASEAKLGIEL